MINNKLIVFIITGKTGGGKTSFLARLIRKLKGHKLSVSGFLAKRSGIENNRQGYEIHLLDTGKTIPLASREPVRDWIRISNFYFNPEAILTGNRILNDPQILNKDLIVVDEIGKFELEDKIWADSVSQLVRKSVSTMIWVVRDTLVEKVIQKWDLQDPVIFDIKKISLRQTEERILSVFEIH